MQNLFLIVILVVCSINCATKGDDSPATEAAPITQVQGLVYGLTNTTNPEAPTEEQFQRILNAPEATVIHVQAYMNDPGMSPAVRDRMVALHKAGKKIILQVFYGPGMRYNWSYHSLAAIGRDPDVAADFMPGFDAVIDSIGAENLYGVVLLEEGGHMGFDIDKPGDWRQNKTGIVSGEENNSAGDNYTQYEANGGAWSATSPNVRRFESDLHDATGLTLQNVKAWKSEQENIFSQWVRRDLYAASHRAVAEHMRQKYPTLKYFVWDIRLGFARVATAWDFSEDYIDGFIADPYSNTVMNYHAYANIRTVNATAEIAGLMWGGYATRDIKSRRLATGYINGATTLGFFEGSGTDASGQTFMRREGRVIGKQDAELAGLQEMDYSDSETFNINRQIMAQFNALPPFHPDYRTLIVSGDIVSNGQTAMEWTQTFYNMPAHCHAAEAYAVRLASYDLVVVHHQTPLVDQKYLQKRYNIPGVGIDRQEFDEYVRNGGLAVVYGLPEGWENSFLAAGLKKRAMPAEQSKTGDFEPSPWLRENLKLNRNYLLNVATWVLPGTGTGVDYADELVRIVTHGKGKVLWLPFANRTPLEGDVHHPQQFADYVQLIQDLTYGFCIYAKGAEFAEQQINDPASAVRYFKAIDAQSNITCILLKDDQPNGQLQVSGTDILTGDSNPVMGKDRTVVIIKGE